MSWNCINCDDRRGRHLDDAIPACPVCGTANPAAPQPAAGRAAGRIGWRLTLPMHVAVPLAADLVIGRETPGLIGDILQRFEHVSRQHLHVQVADSLLQITPHPDSSNPAYVLDAPELDSDDQAYQLRRIEASEYLNSESAAPLIVCLGQCCYLRFDRGII